MKVVIIVCALLSGCAHAAPQSAPATPPQAERLADARGVPYCARVTAGLYRGGQPTREGVEWLKSLGIKTIINLRHFHGSDEGRWAEEAGLRYERIPLDADEAPSRENIERFMSLVTDRSLGPIYVHCQHGVDRTGAMMAVYRMEVDGWSAASAYAEMVAFGAHSIWVSLRNFVRAYAATGRWRPQAAK